jgi:hypothetical protein
MSTIAYLKLVDWTVAWCKVLRDPDVKICVGDTGDGAYITIDAIVVDMIQRKVVVRPQCANTSCNGNKRGDNGRCENCNGQMEDRA